jgi:hypothetical protein
MIDLGNGLTFEISWGEDDWETETWVVVSRNPDPRKHIISKDSPLGRALVNGEEVFESPGGPQRYRIMEVKDHAGNKISVADLKKKAPVNQSYTAFKNPASTRIAGLLRASLSDYFREKMLVPLPELDDKDIQLSLRWYGASEFIPRKQLVAEKENYRGLARMLSARAAEKAVIHFFERMLTGEIKDVSISQLNESVFQQDWKKYDISANGIAYDVKNSRQARLNPSSYVEHCVPQFKQQRGQGVKIIGTLSPYLRTNQVLDHENISFSTGKSVKVLGYVERPFLDRLAKHFTTDTFKLKFSHPYQDGTFLSPWVFDYPVSYYTKRDEGLRRIIETVSIEDWAETRYSPVPVYLALGLEPPAEWQQKMNYTWQVAFLQRMLTAYRKFGLTLPAVFLTVLTHFVDTVTSGKTAGDYSPAEYRKLLFSNSSLSSPLFVHDPLRTVDSLIANLCVLWEAKSCRIHDYSSFRLVSAGILRGSLASHPAKEHTLVAYCGGKINEHVPCGNVPLVLGEHEPCECGMLICDECGYCSKGCRHNAARQADFRRNGKSLFVQDENIADIDVPC